MKTLQTYQKQKDYLICVDSDGCAMDTMDVKHFRCFGPCMVQEWSLQNWESAILTRWNEINLYTLTRGINRFKGLAKALQEIDKSYVKIDGLCAFVTWAETAKELSNDSLKLAIEQTPDNVCLQKALSWSLSVNRAINALPDEDKQPFPLAKEGLKAAHQVADVAVVSSANLDAVLEEWGQHGLVEHVDIVLAQNAGSKAFCIQELLKKGYDTDKVLMCGDAPGDLQAAEKNGVYYYPILVKKERESWAEFISNGVNRLIDGSYGGEYQAQKKAQFLNNLGEK